LIPVGDFVGTHWVYAKGFEFIEPSVALAIGQGVTTERAME
jgi:hypothetical protein